MRIVTLPLRLWLARVAALAAMLLCRAASHAAVDGTGGWFDGTRPGAQAQVAVKLLADAASHGLEPRDYATEPLQRAIEGALQGPPLSPEAADRLRQALNLAMQRYLSDLHDGRVVPSQTGHAYKSVPARAPFDAQGVLRAGLALQDLTSAVRQSAPPLSQYERLREALARYRALGDHAAWRQPLPLLPLPPRSSTRKLEPGQPWSGLPILAARLAAVGDLPAAAVAVVSAEAHYGPALVAAVQSFQDRHGLDADGVVGRSTLVALNATPAQRARQLELALERLRWTPLLAGPRMIVVNIPEFVLRAYEVDGDRVAVRVQSKIIVGKALDTRTPLIEEDLRHIEFQPYWNVPRSIARNELVPRLRRDTGYWSREGFEFVAIGGGAADSALSADKLDAVLAGALRIRQRPGPRNALGDIKFVFPNRESIYLHHTPSVGLFARARRDFSHGCIRVEQPVALAAFALQGLGGWNEARIRRAMTDDEPSTVRLAQPIPVLIAYSTALVKQGRVHFYDDLYGHDRVLDAALKRPRPAPFPSHLLAP
jgi:murein L,D-transpeptidase YcbB/YkuD